MMEATTTTIESPVDMVAVTSTTITTDEPHQSPTGDASTTIQVEKSDATVTEPPQHDELMKNADELMDRPAVSHQIMEPQPHTSRDAQNVSDCVKIAVGKSAKRKITEVSDSTEEEDFAGFDFNGTSANDRPAFKRVKEEEVELSDGETSQRIKNEGQTEEIPSTSGQNQSPPTIVGIKKLESPPPKPPDSQIYVSIDPTTVLLKDVDPRYLRPFKYGWKRELVYRATLEQRRKADKGEVYYFAPNGQKCRRKADIHSNLSDSLEMEDFTFQKDPVGIGTDQEIIRSAKVHHSAQPARKPVNFLDIGTPDPKFGFGKRIPKPKMPKGASPPPASPPARSKTVIKAKPLESIDMEIKSFGQKGGRKSSRGEPCTIQCVQAMGTIPQLQCRKCLCLFHHECMGLPKFGGAVSNYMCENCKNEATTIPVTTSNLPVTTTLSTAIDVTVKVPPDVSFVQQLKNSPKPLRNGGTETQRRSPPKLAPLSSNGDLNLNLNKSTIVGGLTTWVPSGANITSNRQSLERQSPPQSIAIVAGRKYIMVPKKQLMAVSPSGLDTLRRKVDEIDQKGQGNSFKSHTPSMTPIRVTGEDLTTPPPLKKRWNSRRSSVVGSGGNTPITNRTIGSPKQGGSTVSVHSLFASDFFGNVSAGYHVMLNIFQYLKVQELLRAACVCRMWNQVAHSKQLWRTVRMKNSQVYDWTGLAHTLTGNETKHLDLRKMFKAPDTDDQWQLFSDSIAQISGLQKIDMCKCTTTVVERLFKTNNQLRIVNATTLIGGQFDLTNVSSLSGLTELRLKSFDELQIVSLEPLAELKQLKHLAITTVRDLGLQEIEAIGALDQLVSLELGECSEFDGRFAEVLEKLNCLERLRLESGVDQCCTFDIIDTIARMPELTQLELINFDVKINFDTRLAQCTNLRKLLLCPTYITQSATTNRMVLSGIFRLAHHLQSFTWIVTTELLRVTELYVDQCDQKKREPRDHKIPILKPVPGLHTDDTAAVVQKPGEVSQVEILSLQRVEKMFAQCAPLVNFKLINVPYALTWRQCLTDSILRL